VSANLTEQLVERAAKASVSEEVETDDNLVRGWQDELREAREKIEVYRSDAQIARAFRADVKHTEAALEALPPRIAARRAEIAYEVWAKENLGAFTEIPVVSKDKTFASLRKAHLEVLAPELARAIPLKSALWEDWSVWNFKRHRINRFKALPAEALHRARGSLRDFEEVEVWQAVGMADPWLVGIMRTPSGAERFYLLYDWGLETTLDRATMR